MDDIPSEVAEGVRGRKQTVLNAVTYVNVKYVNAVTYQARRRPTATDTYDWLLSDIGIRHWMSKYV